METFLLIGYLLVFALMVILFVKCLKRKVKWRFLFALEILSLVASAVLMNYYNTFPVDRSFFLSAMEHFAETIFSLGAMYVYGFMLGITTITKLVLYIIEKNRSKADFGT